MRRSIGVRRKRLDALRWHFTVDLPLWGRIAFESRLAFVAVVGCVMMRTPGMWDLAVPLAGAGILFSIHRILRARGVLANVGAVPEKPVARREVRPGFTCYGDLRELNAFADSNNEFFEPIIIPFARWSQGAGEWVAIALVLGIAYLGRLRLGLSLPTIALWSIAIFVAASLVRFITASYYRISPGRLDILDAPFLVGNLRLKRWLALDSLAITCRFDEQTLTFESRETTARGAGQGNESETIDLSRVARPHEFVLALYRGTISTHHAPELPDDELIG